VSTNKAFFLPDDLYSYIFNTSVRETPVQRELREKTATLPGAGMMTGPDQVQFLHLLTRAIGAQRALEIGVFTGYGTLGIALALPEHGRLVACDVSEEYTDVGRPYWQRAGVATKIDLRIAPAVKTLDALLAGDGAGSFDLAYVDADKSNYDAYYERALRLLRPSGLICIDNVLWSGRIVDPSDNDASTAALRALNAKIGKDERVDAIILSLGDGLNVVRKR
jgi:predicted O-methyltransferase YrrM